MGDFLKARTMGVLLGPLFICALMLTVEMTGYREREESNEDCDMEKFDRCGATVCYYCRQDEFRTPATTKQMLRYCKEEKEAEECVRHYSARCLEPFPRQALNVFLTNVAKSNAQRCSREGIREHLLNYQCVEASYAGLKACTNHSLYEMMKIAKAPSDDQIPIGCCMVNRWKSCMVDAYSSKCDEQGVKYIKKRVNTFASELIDFTCGRDYSIGSEKCRKLESKLPKADRKEKRPESMLPLMLKLIDSYA